MKKFISIFIITLCISFSSFSSIYLKTGIGSILSTSKITDISNSPLHFNPRVTLNFGWGFNIKSFGFCSEIESIQNNSYGGLGVFLGASYTKPLDFSIYSTNFKLEAGYAAVADTFTEINSIGGHGIQVAPIFNINFSKHFGLDFGLKARILTKKTSFKYEYPENTAGDFYIHYKEYTAVNCMDFECNPFINMVFKFF